MRVDVTEKSFGLIEEFDSYDLDIVRRNTFLQIPKNLIIKKYPEKTVDPFDEERIKLSDNFFDDDFIDRKLQEVDSVETLYVDDTNSFSEFVAHIIDIKTIYDNLQRLCLEVMEPVFEITGRRPFIEKGLLFKNSLNDVDMDSFFGDQIQGNAVVFNFKNDEDESMFIKALNYINQFSLFDRLYIDRTLKKYQRPTLMVSVNDKRRNVVEVVRRK